MKRKRKFVTFKDLPFVITLKILNEFYLCRSYYWESDDVKYEFDIDDISQFFGYFTTDYTKTKFQIFKNIFINANTEGKVIKIPLKLNYVMTRSCIHKNREIKHFETWYRKSYPQININEQNIIEILTIQSGFLQDYIKRYAEKKKLLLRLSTTSTIQIVNEVKNSTSLWVDTDNILKVSCKSILKTLEIDENSTNVLEDWLGVFLHINIPKKKLYVICDNLTNYCKLYGEIDYRGIITS